MTSPRAIADRHLYLCTADRPDLAHFLAACIAGGVDVVQLRDKRLEARPLVERARLARSVCADHGVPFILNDRPDLALEVGADGVHVGQDDAPAALARRILGPDAVIGLSTHGPGDLAGAIGPSGRGPLLPLRRTGRTHADQAGPSRYRPGLPAAGHRAVAPPGLRDRAGSLPRESPSWLAPAPATSSSCAT